VQCDCDCHWKLWRRPHYLVHAYDLSGEPVMSGNGREYSTGRPSHTAGAIGHESPLDAVAATADDIAAAQGMTL